jgi:hypothetical protein
MPNWCNNQLQVRGDKNVIDDFISKITLTAEEAEKSGQKYDILSKLVPTPQELMDTVSGFFGEGTPEQLEQKQKEAQNKEKYGYKDWYDWQYANWGTKWGDCHTFIEVRDETADTKHITVSFSSAWSPPTEGISRVASLFPTLEFVMTYEESGMDFYGIAYFDGEFSSYVDDCYEMSNIDGWNDIDYEDEENDPCELSDTLIYKALGDLLEQSGFGRETIG